MKATEIKSKNNITIGGSEVAVALGKSEWTSPYKFWLLKTGRDVQLPPTEAMKRGIIAEKFIHEYFMDLNPNLKLEKYQMPLQIGIARGTIDAVYCTPSGEKLIIDYKSSHLDLTENLPIEYILQLNWYGGLYETIHKLRPKLGIVSCDGYFNIKFIPVEYDSELFNRIDIKIGEWYQKHIIEDIEIEPNIKERVDVLDKITDLKNDKKELDKSFILKLIKYQDLNIRKKDIEDDIEKIKDEIKIAMSNFSKAVCGDFKISYDLQTRISIDTKKLNELVSDDVIEKCTKKSSFRVLRIS